jgi:vancomycin permeability regulator SanA
MFDLSSFKKARAIRQINKKIDKMLLDGKANTIRYKELCKMHKILVKS